MSSKKRPLSQVSDLSDNDDNVVFDSDDGLTVEGPAKNDNDSLSDDDISSNSSSIVSSEDSEDTEEDSPNINQGFEWSSKIKKLKRFTFTGKSGPQKTINRNADGALRPIDLFLSFVNDDVLQLMVTETNRYAEQYKNGKHFSKESAFNRWKDTNIPEMKTFLGIIMCMGLVNFPHMHFYWKTDPIYYHPLFHKIGLSYNRFSLMLRFWHFADNSLPRGNGSRVYKVQPLIDLIMCNVREIYSPGDTVLIDETIIPFRRVLKYHSSKSHKYGVKIYKLCTTKGFVYSFSVYGDKIPDTPGLDKPGSIVIDLAANLLNDGRLFITNDFYTSILLAQYMYQYASDLCGKLRKNAKYIPKEILTTKLKRDEFIARQSNNVTIIKWHDERDVLMLCTCHGKEKEATGKYNKQGKFINKPKAIVTYNKGKLSRNFSDKINNYHSPVRKSVIWYKRVAMELIFGSMVVNSWLLYNELTNGKDTLLRFTERLVNSLLNTDHADVKDELLPQTGHFISKIPRIANRKDVRKRCYECNKRKTENCRNVKTVDTECKICRRAYCLDCFEMVHKPK